MRRPLSLLLAMLLALAVCMASPVYAADYAPDFDVTANAVYMINLDNDMVIYEKNAEELIYPASLTKIMTAILTIENIPDLDNTMIELNAYVENAIYVENLKNDGLLSLAGLYRGEKLSARNLLYAIMLPSGNEAAMMLGYYIGDGSIEYFAQMMNEKAAEIGCKNTHFVNTNGLHNPEHYTTAYDLALIARYAMGLKGFMDICNTVSYDGGPTERHEHLYWRNTNKMLDPESPVYYAPISGMKTGSTLEAGRCLISTAVKDDYTYLCVVCGCPFYDENGEIPEINPVFPLTKQLYEWAFRTFRVKTLVENGKSVGEVPLKYVSDKDHLLLMSGADYTALLPAEIEPSSVYLELEIPDAVGAPVEKGQHIGEIHLFLANEEISVLPCIAAESVAASPWLILLRDIRRFFQLYWVKFAICYLILLIIGYIVLTIIRNKNKMKYGNYR